MDGRATIGCNPRYLQTIPGILKIVEIVLTILTFALSFGGYWDGGGGGWVEFVGITCCINIAIWLVLHLLSVIPQIFVNYLIELILYCVMVVMLLISGIVAAARAGQLAPYAYWYPWLFKQQRDTIGACSFFAFASAIVCGVDAIFQFFQYRRGNLFQSSATSTTVTTTTTTSAVKVEY